MGSSEDPSLVNNVDELGLVYQGLSWLFYTNVTKIIKTISERFFGLGVVSTSNLLTVYFLKCVRQG